MSVGELHKRPGEESIADENKVE